MQRSLHFWVIFNRIHLIKLSHRLRRVLTPVALAAAALIVAIGPAFGQTSHLSLPAGTELNGSDRQAIAVTSDGTHIAYISRGALYIRGIGEEEKPMLIEGLAAGSAKSSPAFSPDGHSIAYWSMNASPEESALERVPVSGVMPTIICKADAPFGFSWTPDRYIAYGQGSKGIWRVPTRGGTPENIVKVESHEIAHGPQVLPGAQYVLFTLADANAPSASRWDRAKIVLQSISNGERKIVIPAGHDARYLASGHLVYALNGKLMAVRFDLDKMATIGTPVSVAEDVMMASGGATGTAQFSVSTSGTLVYIANRSSAGNGRPAGAQIEVISNWFDELNRRVK